MSAKSKVIDVGVTSQQLTPTLNKRVKIFADRAPRR
jgi:hypothetical protein